MFLFVGIRLAESALVMISGLGQRYCVYQWQESGTILVHWSSANSVCPRPVASQRGQPGTLLPACVFLFRAHLF